MPQSPGVVPWPRRRSSRDGTRRFDSACPRLGARVTPGWRSGDLSQALLTRFNTRGNQRNVVDASFRAHVYHFGDLAVIKVRIALDEHHFLVAGEPIGNVYPVLAGVKTGDKVILSGIQMIQEGAPVQPMETPGPAKAGS